MAASHWLPLSERRTTDLNDRAVTMPAGHIRSAGLATLTRYSRRYNDRLQAAHKLKATSLSV
jgi:hypothetical protein